ncbi:MAG: ChrR family anti-sigma-E factor [Arenibacterium sp.]
MRESSIKHHLSDELLLGYSAGILPEAFSLMVAAHISICDDCRAQVEAYDALGGELIDADSVAMGENSLDSVFSAIDTGFQARVQPKTSRCSVLPQPLQDYVGGGVDAIRWRPVGMGVKQAILKTDKTASARLLYIPAGAAVPDHGHHGMELTMVLQGAFSDEIDHFARGDVEIADEDVNHTPIADVGEDCICLAVTDAPLRFNSLVPRLLQPLLRI